MPAHIILFDFDGTLADSAACAILATRQAFRDHHLPAPADATIIQQMGIPIERCFRTLGAADLDDAAFAALLATFRQHYAAAAESHIRLYPGIAALLAALKAQGRQTGIVSSKKSAILRANGEQLGISAQIDVYIGSDTVQHYKPHPEGIQLALAALNGDPAPPFTSAMPRRTSKWGMPLVLKPAPLPGGRTIKPRLPPLRRILWWMMLPPCSACC